jgi:EAL domain-containing protein (putative c-di-GMP-specific phosphodiesterase class I)/GGDEF domain-containing protein
MSGSTDAALASAPAEPVASGYAIFLDGLAGYLADRDDPAGLLVVQLTNLDRIDAVAGPGAGHSLGGVFAARLEQTLRRNDWMLALAGDRLAVVLDGVRHAGQLLRAAHRISRLAAELRMPEPGPALEVRVGAALFPEHARSAEQLLKGAERAVELAAVQRSSSRIHRLEAPEPVADPWELEAALGTALEAVELSVVYQPQVDAATRRPCGAEALLRWRHPKLGAVPPGQFIPVAESTGLIAAFTRFVLDSAARDAAAWAAAGTPLPVAVNVSPVLLEHGDLVASFEQAAAARGLGLDCFVAEVTESDVVWSADRGRETLAALRAAGMRVSIDDFGTGQLSLADFEDIPADQVKIDRSFVAALLDGEPNTRLVRTTIELVHGFGLEVVAEGVERDECADCLEALGCDVLQGFRFSAPLAREAFKRWVAEAAAAPAGAFPALPRERRS